MRTKTFSATMTDSPSVERLKEYAMNRKTRTHLKNQRGIAMLVALLALVLLAAIGMGLMFIA